MTITLLSSIPKKLQREEKESSEWRRRVDECARQAKEEAERGQVIFEQAEKKLNDNWVIQLQEKEVGVLCVVAEGCPSLYMYIRNYHAGWPSGARLIAICICSEPRPLLQCCADVVWPPKSGCWETCCVICTRPTVRNKHGRGSKIRKYQERPSRRGQACVLVPQRGCKSCHTTIFTARIVP